MTLTEEELSALPKLIDKHPVVKKLWERLKFITDSPYYDAYLTVQTQLMSWNSQLKERKINIFGDKDLKEFERAHKYFTEMEFYHNTLEKLKVKMTPVEIEKADKEATTLYEKLLEEQGKI